MVGDEIKNFGRREHLYISDFDHYMTRNNPIVTFTDE